MSSLESWIRVTGSGFVSMVAIVVHDVAQWMGKVKLLKKQKRRLRYRVVVDTLIIR